MIEVYPIQDKKEQERICSLCNVTYDVDKMAYAGYLKGELSGVLQFRIQGDCGYVYDLENTKNSDSTEVLFVMGRAALNFIDLCGVTKNYFIGRTEGREALIKAIGYELTEHGKWFMDTAGFFEGPCECDKK